MENTDQPNETEEPEPPSGDGIRPALARAGDWLKRATSRAGEITLLMIQAWAEMEHPCRRCRRKFQRRYMHHWYFTSKGFPDLVCAECLATLKAERKREIVETHEHRILQQQLKRAMENGRAATLILPEWLQTLDDCNWRCAYCGTGPYEVMEHLIPLTKGGGTTVDNCVPACRPCNSRKRDHHPDVIVGRARNVLRVRAYLRQRALPPPPGDVTTD